LENIASRIGKAAQINFERALAGQIASRPAEVTAAWHGMHG